MPEEKIILKVPATIEKITTMKDKSLRLQVETQELNPSDKGIVMSMHEQQGVFIFVPQEVEISESDLDDLPNFTMDKDEKSPGQILRGRMFVYYKEKNKTKDGFFQWYATALEKIGQEYLDRLQ